MLRLVTNNQSVESMKTPSQGLMQCSVCKLDKSLSEMTAAAVKGNRKWKCCKACANSYTQKYRDSNHDKYLEYHRKWRTENKDRLNKRISELRIAKISKMTPETLAAFHRKESEAAKRQSEIIKDQVFKAYGGWKCACCNETEKCFLTIDHVLNDGYKLRKEKVHGHSTRFYRWLKNSGYPKNFQVLCMNCNFGKRMNGGIYPHKQGVTTMAQASRGKCPEAQGDLKRSVR